MPYINKVLEHVFETYGYAQVPLEQLPAEAQGYIKAYQAVIDGLVPTLLHSYDSNVKTVFSQVKAEVAHEVLAELTAYIRTAQKDLIISAVDGMNNNAVNK